VSGQKDWTFTNGHIPLDGADELSLLNTGSKDVEVEMTVHYTDRDPVGPYRVTVAAGRLRRIRVNDLIDPLPVPLATDYALVIRAAGAIVADFTKR
jgi:hypothetical protein